MREYFESDKFFETASTLSQALQTNESHFLHVAQFAVKANLPMLNDQALAQEMVLNGAKIHSHILFAKLEYQQGRYLKSQNYLNEALVLSPQSEEVWALIGNLCFFQKKYREAKSAYETVLASTKSILEGDKKSLVLSRLGYIYLSEAYVTEPLDPFAVLTPAQKSFMESQALFAKDIYISACKLNATSQTWLGVGRSCFMLGQYADAENSLSEANVLNPRDSYVWINLALLCLVQDRISEANQSLKQALRIGIDDTRTLRFFSPYV